MPKLVRLDAAALERVLFDALDVRPNAKLMVEDGWVQLTTPGSKFVHHDVVMRAKEEGRKIAFRCNCGCHRTGRLAGYYQMKYRGLSYDEAKELMMERGRWMFFYPGLKQQLKAMADYLAGQPCSTESKFCIATEDDK